MSKPLDLIELSDTFRRASTQTFSKMPQSPTLVSLTRYLGTASTWIDLTYPENHWVNKKPLDQMGAILSLLKSEAAQAGYTEIILPFHKDNPVSEILSRQSFWKQEGYGELFSFKETEYCRDQSPLGIIDLSIPTILDEGLRGVAAIDDDLKYKWNNDLRRPA